MTRWFDPLERTNTVAKPLIPTEADLRGLDPWDPPYGQTVQDWDVSSSFRVTDPAWDGEPDDVLMTHLGAFPIYSARLRQALTEAGIAGIQYLPIQVFRHDGSQIAGFSIANILNVMEALDLDRSDYQVYPEDYFLPHRRGQLRDLKRPVLIESAVQGYHIIRLKEYPVFICVSEVFKEVFEARGFTGYSFIELDKR